MEIVLCNVHPQITTIQWASFITRKTYDYGFVLPCFVLVKIIEGSLLASTIFPGLSRWLCDKHSTVPTPVKPSWSIRTNSVSDKENGVHNCWNLFYMKLDKNILFQERNSLKWRGLWHRVRIYHFHPELLHWHRGECPDAWAPNLKNKGKQSS